MLVAGGLMRARRDPDPGCQRLRGGPSPTNLAAKTARTLGRKLDELIGVLDALLTRVQATYN